MVISSDHIDIRMSKERTDQALAGLEKLKSIISNVENRYNILEAALYAMFDEAISKVQAIKSDLDKMDAPRVDEEITIITESLTEKDV